MKPQGSPGDPAGDLRKPRRAFFQYLRLTYLIFAPAMTPVGAFRNLLGSGKKPVGADRNAAGGNRNAAGADRNTAGADRNVAGADQNAAGGDRNSVGGDENPMGSLRNLVGARWNVVGAENVPFAPTFVYNPAISNLESRWIVEISCKPRFPRHES